MGNRDPNKWDCSSTKTYVGIGLGAVGILAAPTALELSPESMVLVDGISSSLYNRSMD